jgi:outer membrane receptor protein involved in Fe transport
MFSVANFQGASNTNLADARNLYAVLTGRVTAINANAILSETTGKYTYLGKDVDRYRQRQMGYFAQDAWRIKPNVTFTFGLRWDVQFRTRS